MALRSLGVAFGMSAFVGSHLTLSHPPIREDIISRIGQDRFKGLYSMVSFATLFPTVYFYAKHARGTGPQFWKGTSFLQRAGGFGFKALGAVTFSQALFGDSPIAKGMTLKQGEKLKDEDIEVKGINRISRHSTFMAFAFLGLGNILTRGFLSDILFWGTFPTFWVIGSMHQDERLKRTYPESFFQNTSLWPGQAIIEGRQNGQEALKELEPKAIAVALIAPLFFL